MYSFISRPPEQSVVDAEFAWRRRWFLKRRASTAYPPWPRPGRPRQKALKHPWPSRGHAWKSWMGPRQVRFAAGSELGFQRPPNCARHRLTFAPFAAGRIQLSESFAAAASSRSARRVCRRPAAWLRRQQFGGWRPRREPGQLALPRSCALAVEFVGEQGAQRTAISRTPTASKATAGVAEAISPHSQLNATGTRWRCQG